MWETPETAFRRYFRAIFEGEEKDAFERNQGWNNCRLKGRKTKKPPC